jgi:hypothetical protein
MADSSLQSEQGKEIEHMKRRKPKKSSNKSRKPFFPLVEKCKKA